MYVYIYIYKHTLRHLESRTTSPVLAEHKVPHSSTQYGSNLLTFLTTLNQLFSLDDELL